MAGCKWEKWPTADFEIPVFMTPTSSREATEERLRSEELARVTEPFTLTPESGITILPSQQGGIGFHLSRGRESASIISLAGFTVLWTGVVAIIIYGGAPLLFPIVFGAFDLLLLLILLFQSFGACRIAVESGELSVQTILFGLTKESRIPCSTIARISVTGPGSVKISQKDGKQVSVWWIFKRRQTADWLADEIRKAAAQWRDPESF